MTLAGFEFSRRLIAVRAAMQGAGSGWSLVIHVDDQSAIALALEQPGATLATIPLYDEGEVEFDRVEILYPHLGRVAILGPRRPTMAAQLAATAARVEAGETLPAIAQGAR